MFHVHDSCDTTWHPPILIHRSFQLPPTAEKRKSIDKRKLGCFRGKGREEAKPKRECNPMISPVRPSRFRAINHSVCAGRTSTLTKIDNLPRVRRLTQNGSERSRDRPMVNYSKTRACPRIPISEMEDLIYYSASRFVARGVFVYLSTRMRNY